MYECYVRMCCLYVCGLFMLCMHVRVYLCAMCVCYVCGRARMLCYVIMNVSLLSIYVKYVC